MLNITMKRELLKLASLFVIALMLVIMTGCTSVQKMVPSFWDDNQSRSIIDIRMQIEKIDCSANQLTQVKPIENELRWFQLYSESKGIRQHDVLAIVEPMQETVGDWVEHEKTKPNNEIYCGLKKDVLEFQASTAATAILGRF